MSLYEPADADSIKNAFEAVIADWPDVTAETMFGCPSYRADETIFAVLVTEGIALTRLPDEDRAALEEEFEAGPFEANGRVVSKWVQVFVDDPPTVETLAPYIRSSYEAALAESV